jgi:hypothetical protein
MNICLIGPHGAGKTTLGQLLAPSLGASFRDEYGRTLREAWLSEDPDATALRFDEAFDRAVIEGDLARDEERWGPVCVMETWHPGNFAYAEVRSPEVARSFEARARRQVDALACRGLLVQPVTAAREVLIHRLSEPGGTPDELVGFFESIAARALAVAHRWGLTVLPVIDTGRASPEACAAMIRAQASAARAAFAEFDS